MTVDQFIDALALKTKYDKPVRKVSDLRDYLIRIKADFTMHVNDTGCCPIEWLAGVEMAYSIAGPRLGLSDEDIRHIILAADSRFRDHTFSTEFMRQERDLLKVIRRRLIAALGWPAE